MGCWLVLLSAALLVVVAFFIARHYFFRLLDRQTAAFQTDMLAQYYNEVLNIYKDMRGWRHDYRSHIQTLKAYRRNEDNKKIDSYLEKLEGDLIQVDTLIKSGNITLDAILNSKLSLAASRDIQTNVKANLPESLTVSEIDLCVILGNLLDNAAEACAKIPEACERFIRVYIAAKRGHLYISVTNSSVDKTSRYEKFISEKPGFHGFGLVRMDRVVAKYQGYVKRAGEEGAFTTEIMLPL